MKKFYLLLPNIRSGFNVGAFFRTADALGVDKIFLAGYTPYPPHTEIAKTALGAEDFVDWQYFLDPFELVKKLKKQGVEIIALENTKTAKLLTKYKPKKEKVCLVVGNEVEGISEEILELADTTLKIEMKGKKESLNVSIAGGIAISEISKNF